MLTSKVAAFWGERAGSRYRGEFLLYFSIGGILIEMGRSTGESSGVEDKFFRRKRRNGASLEKKLPELDQGQEMSERTDGFNLR